MKTFLLISALIFCSTVQAGGTSGGFEVRVKVIASVVGNGIEISPTNSTCKTLDSNSEICWISNVRERTFQCESEDTLRMVRSINSDTWKASQFNSELCHTTIS